MAELSVDDYISEFDGKQREILEKVRTAVVKVAPDAVEVISWGMPTYKLGRDIFHFAAMKHHLGAYPGPDPIAAMRTRLAGFKTSKGAVQLPWALEPFPYGLIEDLVKFNVAFVEFEKTLAKVTHKDNRDELRELLHWVAATYELTPVYKWNKPTFTIGGRFVASFDVAKGHFSIVDPEECGIAAVAEEADKDGYAHTARILKIPWGSVPDRKLIGALVEAKLAVKEQPGGFWERG
jgi:uncharacterized protein YdhG (YjbR/CyaY superfamily)